MSLHEQLSALNAKLQTILRPGVDDVLEKHISLLQHDGTLDRVLKPGQKAPSFTLRNQHGEQVSSADLLSKGPLVVAFTRGGWCPFCAAEAKAMDAVYDQFKEKGVDLVLLTPQALDGIKRWGEDSQVRFSLLRDEGNRVGEAFGVVYTFPEDLKDVYLNKFAKNIPEINDTEGWKLPFPARFILDSEGVVRDSEANPNYRTRPEPEESLSIIEKLGIDHNAKDA